MCSQCGAKNSDEAIFCQKCGKRLETTGQKESTLLSPLPVPASPYENFSYPVPDASKPHYPPPPPGIPYESTSTPYEPKPPLRPHSNRRYLIVIAVFVAMLVGVGGFELGQLVNGHQQGNSSNTPSPSNDSGTIPANTAQASTTFTPTLGCPTSRGYFKIVNVNSGLVLDVPNGSLASGIAIQQYPYVGALNQQWQFVPVGQDYFEIVNRNSGLVLDVPYASIDSKVYIQQWPDNGTSAQQWQCVPVGQDYFKIVNRNSGLVLDVPSTSSHSPLLQDTYSGGPNQQWRFV